MYGDNFETSRTIVKTKVSAFYRLKIEGVLVQDKAAIGFQCVNLYSGLFVSIASVTAFF